MVHFQFALGLYPWLLCFVFLQSEGLVDDVSVQFLLDLPLKVVLGGFWWFESVLGFYQCLSVHFHQLFFLVDQLLALLQDIVALEINSKFIAFVRDGRKGALPGAWTVLIFAPGFAIGTWFYFDIVEEVVISRRGGVLPRYVLKSSLVAFEDILNWRLPIDFPIFVFDSAGIFNGTLIDKFISNNLWFLILFFSSFDGFEPIAFADEGSVVLSNFAEGCGIAFELGFFFYLGELHREEIINKVKWVC